MNGLGNGAELRQKADDTIDAGYNRATNGLAAARDGAHGVVDKSDQALASAQSFIREHANDKPLQTVAVAAGVGILLSMLMRR
jgi:ElaB/YqjD/DUF883 family membrane-anchored ribosome-binding protein